MNDYRHHSSNDSGFPLDREGARLAAQERQSAELRKPKFEDFKLTTGFAAAADLLHRAQPIEAQTVDVITDTHHLIEQSGLPVLDKMALVETALRLPKPVEMPIGFEPRSAISHAAVISQRARADS